MGFKDWVANAPVATFGIKDQVVLYKDAIHRVSEVAGHHPLDGVSARVEDGNALESRVTATRLVALGVFAFAAKKKRGGEAFLTIEGPDFFWAIEVDRKKKGDAMKFAAKINDQVRKHAAGSHATP